MTLAQETQYMPRLVDKELEDGLMTFGAVQIDGPKWCGKTWSALRVARSDIRLDDASSAELVSADLSIALIGDKPHLIDEWQRVPAVRDEVRRAVDSSGSQPGSFILTGSSAPPTNGYYHTGAGRIGSIRMRPMSLREQGISNGEVSLTRLFNGEFEPCAQRKAFGLSLCAEAICRGGWPATIHRPFEYAVRVPGQYVESICSENARRDGRNPDLVRAAIRSLARNNASAAKLSTITADLLPDDGASQEASNKTVASYLAWLKDMFLYDELPGWAPPIKARERLRVKPKRYFADPSLAAAALGASPERLLRESQLMGDLFENLVVRDVSAYASAMRQVMPPTLHYYRDSAGHEVDLVIELADGRWGAIEVKLGENKVDEASAALLHLQRAATSNSMAQQPEPSFLMVLVANGTYAHRTSDGIIVCPVSLLGE